VVVCGDRGMITEASIATLAEHGFGWITALKAPQVRKLVDEGALQLSLFDERNLAEITSEAYPGERLVVCKNPHVARERARKREALLQSTEQELAKVKASVDNPRGRLHGKPAGLIGERAGRVVNRFKVAKHFKLLIEDGRFAYAPDEEAIAAEAALDGFYVLRTSLGRDDLSAQAVVRAYKQLATSSRPCDEEPGARDPPRPPPPRAPGAGARLPLHARLRRPLRDRAAPRSAPLQRRRPTCPRRSGRPGTALARQQKESRQQAHRGRPAPLQLRRPRAPQGRKLPASYAARGAGIRGRVKMVDDWRVVR